MSSATSSRSTSSSRSKSSRRYRSSRAKIHEDSDIMYKSAKRNIKLTDSDSSEANRISPYSGSGKVASSDYLESSINTDSINYVNNRIIGSRSLNR
jgi:hypothetical protein